MLLSWGRERLLKGPANTACDCDSLISHLLSVCLDERLPAELGVAGTVVGVGLGGGRGSHHPRGGRVSQQFVVSLGEELAAVVGDPLAPRHPPGQDLVQVGVQGGAGELQPLIRHHLGAGRAVLAGLAQVERERTGGLTAGQASAEPTGRGLPGYLGTV